jgi:hypothetical protein
MGPPKMGPPNSSYPVAYRSDKLRDNTKTKPRFWFPDLVLLVKKK